MQKDTQDAKSDDASKDSDSGTATPSQLQAMTPVMQIQSQLKANKLEIQGREAQIARLQAKVNEYQARLNATPGRQQELADIMRNYDESKKNYDELLGKTMASSLATSLNRQQQGDQFRIIDPPSLPDKASFPNRFRVLTGGVGRRPGAGVRVWSRDGIPGRSDPQRDGLDRSCAPAGAGGNSAAANGARRLAAQRWKPWIAVAAAILVAIIIPTGIWYAYFWG